jgi:hypothetical protein
MTHAFNLRYENEDSFGKTYPAAHYSAILLSISASLSFLPTVFNCYDNDFLSIPETVKNSERKKISGSGTQE